MNVEMLLYLLLGILVVLYLVWMWKLASGRLLRLSEADRRADELLRSVLSSEQYGQLTRDGYLDIKSPHHAGCIYRIPRTQGLVKVIEQGRHKTSLCLQPQEVVPYADQVVIHKLMIEGDEETYLRTANTFAPVGIALWED